MEINIDSFLKETEDFLAEEAKKGKGNKEGGSKYPIVYPGVPGGSLTIKLLWNQKSSTVIRQIKRHGGFGEKGFTKIPCLSQYGVDCPICSKMKDIEDTLGQSCGVNKHNAKVQSIAYAQLIDYNTAYKDMPEKGSLILFMFPYTICKQIMTQLNQFGQNSKQLIATNDGKPFVVTTSTKQSFDMYTVTVDPFNTIKSFETDEEYFKCLEELPDLMETMIPKEIDENLMNQVNAAVETMTTEYLGSTVPASEPISQPQQPVNPDVVQSSTTTNTPVAQPSTTVTMETKQPDTTLEQKIQEQMSSDKPTCYGQYSMTEKKCLVCPHGTDCADIS